MKKIFPAVKYFFKHADMLLFFLCLVCSVFGIIIIASATSTYEDGSLRYVLIQTFALIIGIALFVVLTVIDIDIIVDKWIFLYAFSGVLILLLVTPLGYGGSDYGNNSWLRFLGIGIQPSEVVKVIFVAVLAKHISYLKNYKSLNSVLSIAQLVVHFGALFGLLIIVSSDLGSALVYMFIFIVMIFAGGVRLYWFAAGIGVVAVATPFLWEHFLTDRQKERIMAPYDASIDPNGFDVKWDANHSKLAMASGRLTGTGLGEGPQNHSNAIASKHADFIFSVVGEELGMIGCCFVVLLLAAIIIRCVYVGIKSKNTMSMLVCVGVASFIFFQTFENIGMCLGIAPVIGITLPFISYGGSSLFSTFAAIGLVSGVRYRPKPERFRSYG